MLILSKRFSQATPLQPAFQGPLTLGLLLRKILVAPLPPFHAGAKLPPPNSGGWGSRIEDRRRLTTPKPITNEAKKNFFKDRKNKKPGSLPKIVNPLKKSALSNFLGFRVYFKH